MLISIFIILAFFMFGRSGSIVQQYKSADEQIKKVVVDHDRRDKALHIVAEMKKVAEISAKDQKRSVDSLQKLLDQRTVSPDAIRSAVQPVMMNDQSTAEALLDLRFQLTGVLTRDEWSQIFPPPAGAGD